MIDKGICIYYRKCINGCVMWYDCANKLKDKSCKLNGKIKTCLVYIPKHIRKPDTVVFKNKYTVDGVVYS